LTTGASFTYAAEPSGDSLVARAVRGDQDALRRLWHDHRRWVAAILLAHMPRQAELDDLLQEVAVAVVAKISGLREEAAFKPWLRAVALSVAKTNGRRGKVRKAGWLRLAGEAEQREESEPAGVNPALLEEGRRLMELAAELPDGYREPLLLKCVQGMSYREIGRVMGLPETTVETRIARGRRMLRESAQKAGIGGGSEEDEESGAALASEKSA